MKPIVVCFPYSFRNDEESEIHSNTGSAQHNMEIFSVSKSTESFEVNDKNNSDQKFHKDVGIDRSTLATTTSPILRLRSISPTSYEQLFCTNI
jgi:hypothetical protein